MSIVRVGLAETKKFAEGYEAIFGKPKTETGASVPATAASDRSSPRCSRIMEKATLGETLSAEEKKELASSCR